jgi:hypothetical protein
MAFDLTLVGVESLNKGDTVPWHTLQTVTGQRRGSDLYRLAVLTVKQAVESRLDELGRPMTLRWRRSDLVVLTDREASDYNRSAVLSGARRMRRRHDKMASVDRNNLNDEERRRHDSALESDSRVLLAMAAARRRAASQPEPELVSRPVGRSL